MKVRTNTKAGALTSNRSEAFAVKTGVKAGSGEPVGNRR